MYNLTKLFSLQSSPTSSASTRVEESEQDNERPSRRSMMTSPVGDFEPFEEEAEILGDVTIRDEEEDNGDDLFGDNMEK